METEASQSGGGWMRVLVSMVAGVVPPASVWIVSYAVHWLSYDGTCGPHAPDISAHPCDFGTYMDQWAAGFSGVGLFMLTGMALPVGIAAAFGCYVWLRSRADETAD